MTKTIIQFDRRNRPRRAVNSRAFLVPNDWSKLEVDVIDFSAEGFRASCSAVVKVGSFVSLRVPGIGVVAARVVWTAEGQLGAKFIRPIDVRHCLWSTEVDVSVEKLRDIPEGLSVARALAARTSGE
jgi:hypothetical protein